MCFGILDFQRLPYLGHNGVGVENLELLQGGTAQTHVALNV